MHATSPHPRDHSSTAPTAVPIAPADDSAVSWAAILAGAAAAASLSLILVLLGVGLGLSSVSPWAYQGVTAEAFGWATIAWVSFTSIAASGLGGYMAGRLRRRWTAVHDDETYFRDTAHGFLAWATATLLTAALLTSTITGMLGSGTRFAADAAGSMTASTSDGSTSDRRTESDEVWQSLIGYHIDRLFRQRAGGTPAPTASASDAPFDDAEALPSPDPRSQSEVRRAELRSEVERIVRVSRDQGDSTLAEDDADYLAQWVARQTGQSEQDARNRVERVLGEFHASLDDLEAQVREAADEARKASAYAALWLFITLLMGAFVASLLATFGGRQRDTA